MIRNPFMMNPFETNAVVTHGILQPLTRLEDNGFPDDVLLLVPDVLPEHCRSGQINTLAELRVRFPIVSRHPSFFLSMQS